LYELDLGATSDEAVDETAFDPDLWDHVKIHVEHEEWQKVASQTAIFVEDRVRAGLATRRRTTAARRSGRASSSPPSATAPSSSSARRAARPRAGWRALGTGFSQALSNVDRHNIQERDDAKRYAFGVLGWEASSSPSCATSTDRSSTASKRATEAPTPGADQGRVVFP
jgi:hypothetical protein